MKKLVVSEACVACGNCTAEGKYFREQADGKAAPAGSGLVAEADLAQVEALVKLCPVQAISIQEAGGGGRATLQEVRDLINRLAAFKVDDPGREVYRYNSKDYSLSVPYSAHNHRYDFKSESKATSAGLDEFNRLMYAQMSTYIRQLAVDYKNKKLRQFYTYEQKPGLFYYDTNQKVAALLEEIVAKLKDATGGSVAIPEGLAQFDLVPPAVAEAEDYKNLSRAAQLKHFEEFAPVGEVKADMDTLSSFELYINTDYITESVRKKSFFGSSDDYEDVDVYCYDVQEACETLAQDIIRNGDDMTNTDHLDYLIKYVVGIYREAVQKEIAQKVQILKNLAR